MTAQPNFILVCSKCGTPVEQPYGKPDDTGTQFYHCVRCLTPVTAKQKEITVENKFAIDFFKELEKHPEVMENFKPTKVYPGYGSFCDYADPEKNKYEGFKTAKVALWLYQNEHFKTDILNDMLYYGDSEKGVWIKNAEPKLREITTKILGEFDKAHLYKDILHTLKGLSTTEITFSKKVALENGLFDLETKTLTPYTLDEMPFFRYPLTYDETAKDLGDWLTYLNQVAAPEDIPLLQEWMGYCLYPSYKFHRVLWIHGEGRNGKGVYDRTTQGLVGRENFSSIGLEELDGNHRFSLNRLYGKVYNTSSEPTTNKVFRTEIFQRLSGSDPIDSERKGKDERLTFFNLAKLTIIGNTFPKIHNPTVAFKDRMMFVKFSAFIEKKDRIADLEKIWLDDPKKRSALFNWALEGLQRLLINGVFTESKSQEQTEIEFQRVTDTPSAFQKEMGIIDKNLVTTRITALESYTEYCDAIGVEPVGKSEFTKAMQSLAPKVKDGWTRIAGKKERAWLGFGLRQIDNLEQLPQMEHQITLDGNEQAENLIEYKKGVPTVPTVPTAKDCANFHLPSCECQSFDCIAPTYPCPGSCKSFKPIIEEMPSYDDKCEPLEDSS